MTTVFIMFKRIRHLLNFKDKYTHGHSSRVAQYSRMIAGKHRENVYEGILINRAPVVIHCKVGADKKNADNMPVPSMILFDSLDNTTYA